MLRLRLLLLQAWWSKRIYDVVSMALGQTVIVALANAHTRMAGNIRYIQMFVIKQPHHQHRWRKCFLGKGKSVGIWEPAYCIVNVHCEREWRARMLGDNIYMVRTYVHICYVYVDLYLLVYVLYVHAFSSKSSSSSREDGLWHQFYTSPSKLWCGMCMDFGRCIFATRTKWVMGRSWAVE